jgi:D-alanyl-D-alanine dipeptidase/carboxypeptidase
MKKIMLDEYMIHTGSLLLINQKYRYHYYEQETIIPRDEQSTAAMEKEAGLHLQACMRKIDGWKELFPFSGLRTHEQQEQIYSACADPLSAALPGHSEHEAGLAVDLCAEIPSDWNHLSFSHTELCRTFAKTAAEYGFIERYPCGLESITKLSAKPWHYRYIGVPHAAIIKEQGITLEEYIEKIRTYKHKDKNWFTYTDSAKQCAYRISFHDCRDGILTIEENSRLHISGDNISGVILTEMIKL